MPIDVDTSELPEEPSMVTLHPEIADREDKNGGIHWETSQTPVCNNEIIEWNNSAMTTPTFEAMKITEGRPRSMDRQQGLGDLQPEPEPFHDCVVLHSCKDG